MGLAPDPLTDWWHGPHHDLDSAAALTGYNRWQIRDFGKSTFKFRYWRGRKGAVNLLPLEEIFLLRIFRELDAVVVGRNAGALLMPAVIDYARRVLAAPEAEMARDVQFFGWPNDNGGWTWIEAIDSKPPAAAPEVQGAVCVVVSGSRLIHGFLRDVLRGVDQAYLHAVQRSVPAEAA
jgi:hypothetical protein